jgi:hypothetical protein
VPGLRGRLVCPAATALGAAGIGRPDPAVSVGGLVCSPPGRMLGSAVAGVAKGTGTCPAGVPAAGLVLGAAALAGLGAIVFLTAWYMRYQSHIVRLVAAEIV